MGVAQRMKTHGVQPDTVDRVANYAYRESRRPRRAKIMQVPAVNDGQSQSKRSVVVPYVPQPITWARAREIGRAYVRLRNMQEPFPKDPPPKKATSKRVKVERYRKNPKGDWWMNKLADVVERRKNKLTPAYRARGERRKRKQAQP